VLVKQPLLIRQGKALSQLFTGSYLSEDFSSKNAPADVTSAAA
jgi:hypothetical protein